MSVGLTSFQFKVNFTPFLAEHVLSMCTKIYQTFTCPQVTDDMKAIAITGITGVFYIVDFSLSLGIFLKYLNLVATFIWSFTDLFVIIISLGISIRFKQLNEKLRNDQEKVGRIPKPCNGWILGGLATQIWKNVTRCRALSNSIFSFAYFKFLNLSDKLTTVLGWASNLFPRNC